MSKRIIFDHVNPKTLQPCVFSHDLYGDNVADEFVETVRKHGVCEPIQCLPNYMVLSGHRRRYAALSVGLKTVPVLVRHDLDASDFDAVNEQIILLNAYREKPTAVKAREYEFLKAIEARKAEQRGKSGLKDPGDHGPQGSSDRGRARDIAAKKSGFGSGKTAEKALAVTKKIAELKSDGKLAAAVELDEKLEKSVAGAAKAIKPPEEIDPWAEPLGRCDFVLNTVVPRTQEAALCIQRALGASAGPFSAGAVNRPIKQIFDLFTEVRKVLVHAQKRKSKGDSKATEASVNKQIAPTPGMEANPSAAG